MRYITFPIHLPPTVHQKYKRLAKKQRITLQDWMLQALRDFSNKQESFDSHAE